MNISLQTDDKETLRRISKTWLEEILESSTLCGRELPNAIKGYIYINGVPHNLMNGSWEIRDQRIYLARAGGIIEPLTKLAILTAIANLTGVIEETSVVTTITTRLTAVMAESMKSVYQGFIRATHTPSKLAVDQANCQVALHIAGSWFLTNGTPAEVNESWIIMDF